MGTRRPRLTAEVLRNITAPWVGARERKPSGLLSPRLGAGGAGGKAASHASIGRRRRRSRSPGAPALWNASNLITTSSVRSRRATRPRPLTKRFDHVLRVRQGHAAAFELDPRSALVMDELEHAHVRPLVDLHGESGARDLKGKVRGLCLRLLARAKPYTVERSPELCAGEAAEIGGILKPIVVPSRRRARKRERRSAPGNMRSSEKRAQGGDEL